MKNLFICNLHKKDVNHFTTNAGLWLRKRWDKPFKKLCNIFTKANIIRVENDTGLSDEEYYCNLSLEQIPCSFYPLSKKKNANNIVLERYPSLDKDESYIFVGNHTCPEDIETMLNIIDRSAYLILGSVESLKYNPEMYLSWLNGVVYVDRKSKKNKKKSLQKMLKILEDGKSLLMCPEGTWNLTPSKPMIPLNWGIIDLAKQTEVPIIPLILEYLPDCCYAKYGEPIYITQEMDKQTGIELLEEEMATLKWNIWEMFPVQKRTDEMKAEFEEMVQKRVAEYPKFDFEYEMSVVRGKENTPEHVLGR